MTPWRLMQEFKWPAPEKIGAGQYDAWAKIVRADRYYDPLAFKIGELHVDLGTDAPALNLVALLAYVERLLREMRVLPMGFEFEGATIWRNGDGAKLHVTVWERGRGQKA